MFYIIIQLFSFTFIHFLFLYFIYSKSIGENLFYLFIFYPLLNKLKHYSGIGRVKSKNRLPQIKFLHCFNIYINFFMHIFYFLN